MFLIWMTVIFGGIALALVSIWWMRSDTNSDSVVEVRKTPRREVEEMTVDEFGELSRQYMVDQGFEIRREEDRSFAVRDDKKFYVHYDPAAESDDPRAVNQMIANMKKSGMDAGILITSGSVEGQAETLAERAEIIVLDPDTLIGWKRNQSNTSDGAESDG